MNYDGVTTLKIFGKGQITLPKDWRDRYDTKHLIAEETPEGLLIKPIVKSVYYETGKDEFGVIFPTGMSAKELNKINEGLS